MAGALHKLVLFYVRILYFWQNFVKRATMHGGGGEGVKTSHISASLDLSGIALYCIRMTVEGKKGQHGMTGNK